LIKNEAIATAGIIFSGEVNIRIVILVNCIFIENKAFIFGSAIGVSTELDIRLNNFTFI
jgi:hypothetical protein